MRILRILDKKLIKYLLWFYSVSFLIATGSGFLAKWEGLAYKSLGWWDVFVSGVVRFGAKLIFILGAIVLIRYLFQKKIISSWICWALHVFFGVGLSFYSIWSQVILGNWLYESNDPVTWEYIYQRAIGGTDYNFFMYFSMVVIVYAYYYFKKQKDYELKESSLKTQLLDSKINALQAQLQPHFLFNALNDISALVDLSPEKSQNAIADLSEMLRLTLNLKDNKLIPLSDEIAILRKYMSIEKIRFDEKLNFEIEIDKDLLSILVPPLLLQPIVENSIKHGFSYSHDHLVIRIGVKAMGGYYHFSIKNNGAPLEKDKLIFGTGISNLITRLETLYDGDFEFDMENGKEMEVITSIKIPV